MKINIKQIAEGWYNLLFRFKNIKINKIKKKRLKKCRDCKMNSIYTKSKRIDEHCTVCGCNIAAKISCLSCECPLGEWKSENEK